MHGFPFGRVSSDYFEIDVMVDIRVWQYDSKLVSVNVR